jgi:hypothetical protein
MLKMLKMLNLLFDHLAPLLLLGERKALGGGAENTVQAIAGARPRSLSGIHLLIR